MAKLDKFSNGCSGQYRENAEDEFPWDYRSGVWYSLLICENGKIERYGFMSGMAQKEKLRLLLKEISPDDDALLMGVWNGQWSTSLFILDIEKSIKKLDELNNH